MSRRISFLGLLVLSALFAPANKAKADFIFNLIPEGLSTLGPGTGSLDLRAITDVGGTEFFQFSGVSLTLDEVDTDVQVSLNPNVANGNFGIANPSPGFLFSAINYEVLPTATYGDITRFTLNFTATSTGPILPGSGSQSFSLSGYVAVPEPSTIGLSVLGLAGVVLRRRRRA